MGPDRTSVGSEKVLVERPYFRARPHMSPVHRTSGDGRFRCCLSPTDQDRRRILDIREVASPLVPAGPKVLSGRHEDGASLEGDAPSGSRGPRGWGPAGWPASVSGGGSDAGLAPAPGPRTRWPGRRGG